MDVEEGIGPNGQRPEEPPSLSVTLEAEARTHSRHGAGRLETGLAVRCAPLTEAGPRALEDRWVDAHALATSGRPPSDVTREKPGLRRKTRL